MVQDNYQPVSGETEDGVFSSGVSVGALLKDERDKKGLTHARISEQTRLSPHVLKALENEDWEKLRGPTLVKGFIRSYAKALGLDAERILAVYEEEVPEQSFADRFVLPSIEKQPLLLRGHITERTWVRIAIDGGDPKEYILKPGDRPQWSARTSFELLIGNAGGITLEFNGKKMDNLGKQGQVVRIKLPSENEKVKVKE